jgi:hypothetical protein
MAPVWEEARATDPMAIFRSVFHEHAYELTRPEDYINHSLYFEAKTFLNGLLIVDDKLTMAHGLEGRVPFLDNDLVDFAMRLPARMKLGNLKEVVRLDENEPGGKAERYFHKTCDGKLILRKMMARHIRHTHHRRDAQCAHVSLARAEFLGTLGLNFESLPSGRYRQPVAMQQGVGDDHLWVANRHVGSCGYRLVGELHPRHGSPPWDGRVTWQSRPLVEDQLSQGRCSQKGLNVLGLLA